MLGIILMVLVRIPKIPFYLTCAKPPGVNPGVNYGWPNRPGGCNPSTEHVGWAVWGPPCHQETAAQCGENSDGLRC